MIEHNHSNLSPTQRHFILKHKRKVKFWMDDFANTIKERGKCHDDSKLVEPEKSMFEKWTSELQVREFGSPEYDEALKQMKEEALLHHYLVNRHHPEHFENGINDMTLHDIVEMLCDWMASAWANNRSINLKYLQERFGIEPQLMKIIVNTLADIDADFLHFLVPELPNFLEKNND